MYITNLNIFFIPNVMVACCINHNLLLGQHPYEVARLIEFFQREGMSKDLPNNRVTISNHEVEQIEEFDIANEKRIALGLYLEIWRNVNGECRQLFTLVSSLCTLIS